MQISPVLMFAAYVLALVNSVAASSGCKIDYYLWNADTDSFVGRLPSTMSKKSYRITIEARLNSKCTKGESAKMTLRGPIRTSRVENTSPYVIFSDDGNGDLFGKYFGKGDYKISSSFYTKDNTGGSLIVKGDYSFKVTDSRNLRESE